MPCASSRKIRIVRFSCTCLIMRRIFRSKAGMIPRIAALAVILQVRGSAEDPKRAYREMVEAVDEGIGKIVAALNEQGIVENTVVWFFSDNGAIALGSNQPLRGTKATDWEGGHRVPSILSWPGKLSPQRSATLRRRMLSESIDCSMLCSVGRRQWASLSQHANRT